MKKRRLIVVIHGVGDHAPGSTMGQFIGALSENQHWSLLTSEHWISSKVQGSYGINELESSPIPIKVTKLESEKYVTTATEVSWSEEINFAQSKIGLATEVIRTALSLGYLVHANALQFSSDSRLDRLRLGLVRFVLVLLQSVNAVLNPILAVGIIVPFVFSGGFEPLVHDLNDPKIHLIIGISAAVCLGILLKIKPVWLFYRLFRRGMLIALASLSAYALSCFILSLHLSQPVFLRLDEFSNTEEKFTTLAENYILLIFLFLQPCWLLIFLVTSVLIVAAWLSEHRTIQTGTLEPNVKRHFYVDVLCLIIFIWMFFVTLIWVAYLQTVKAIYPSHDHMNEIMFLGLRMMPLVFLVAVFIFVMSYKIIISRDSIIRAGGRLLFNEQLANILRIGVLALTVGAIILFVDWIRVIGCGQVPSFCMELFDFDEFVKWSIHAAFIFTTLIVLSFPFWADKLVSGLGIISDITDYLAVVDWSYDSLHRLGGNRRSKRSRVIDRATRTVSHMVKTTNPEEVILLGHSQGSVIAIETINRNLHNKIFSRGFHNKSSRPKVELVTMGSPYTHIYRHYFKKQFVLPKDFSNRLARWVNIYRDDDYVGTTLNTLRTATPEEVNLGPGGHTGYWTDPKLIEYLFNQWDW